MKRKLAIAAGALVVLAFAIRLTLPSILVGFGLHPAWEGETHQLPGKRALIVTTSHGVLNEPGETEGPATGVAASELTHPYYDFLEAGMEVDVASIKGGRIPIDPATLRFPVASPEDERFIDDPIFRAKVANSMPIAEVDFTRYDAIFLSGGWGAASISALPTCSRKRSAKPTTPDRRSSAGSVMGLSASSRRATATAIS